MKIEKRRYKIKGFREDGDKIRVLLLPDDPVIVSNTLSLKDMMQDPGKAAQHLMQRNMQKLIHDSFSISMEEYQEKKYMVGESVTVTISRNNV